MVEQEKLASAQAALELARASELNTVGVIMERILEFSDKGLPVPPTGRLFERLKEV